MTSGSGDIARHHGAGALSGEGVVVVVRLRGERWIAMRALYSTTMLAQRLEDHDDTPSEDHIVVLRGASWADYQRLTEMRGDQSAPRIAYLEGALEIMSPSLTHEALKSLIGRLLEVWCLEKGIEFMPYGSWTLEKKEESRGVEPDECYVFGVVSAPQRPDLAIEVVWTSGGLDKLEIYRKLSVREVWFWRRGRLTAHVLRGEAYEEAPQSEVLSGIDLTELARYLDRPTASQAIREYRAALQAR
jgi:Uma2 family endonuclease